MMPTIRIDDDVFNGLKSLAEPFIDTPNSVIRSLLQERGVLSKPPTPDPVRLKSEPALAPSKTEASRSTKNLTPQSVYEIFLLHVLADKHSGNASKREATQLVIKLMKSHGFIGSADLQRVSTGETKAENTIAWGRNALKERGLLRRDSPMGVWQLTEEGMRQGKTIVLPRKIGGDE